VWSVCSVVKKNGIVAPPQDHLPNRIGVKESQTVVGVRVKLPPSGDRWLRRQVATAGEHTEHTETGPTKICAPFPCIPRIPWSKKRDNGSGPRSLAWRGGAFFSNRIITQLLGSRYTLFDRVTDRVRAPRRVHQSRRRCVVNPRNSFNR
jgi:hypothetical protein